MPHRFTRALAVVCASVCVFAAARASAATRTFAIDATCPSDSGSVYFYYGFNNPAGAPDGTVVPIQNLATGVNATFLVRTQAPEDVGVENPTTFGILGLLGDGSVRVALDNDDASRFIGDVNGDVTFQEAFGTSFTESQVRTWAADGDASSLKSFFLHTQSLGLLPAVQLPAIQSPGTFVDFSAAQAGGTVTVTVVPEPGGLLLLGVAAWALSFHRRRRWGC